MNAGSAAQAFGIQVGTEVEVIGAAEPLPAPRKPRSRP